MPIYLERLVPGPNRFGLICSGAHLFEVLFPEPICPGEYCSESVYLRILTVPINLDLFLNELINWLSPCLGYSTLAIIKRSYKHISRSKIFSLVHVWIGGPPGYAQ